VARSWLNVSGVPGTSRLQADRVSIADFGPETPRNAVGFIVAHRLA
jgi:hypothetical protein